jgi:hypothetical protein
MLKRRLIPPLDEFINENKDEKAEDFDHASISQDDRFWQPKTKKIRDFGKIKTLCIGI